MRVSATRAPASVTSRNSPPPQPSALRPSHASTPSATVGLVDIEADRLQGDRGEMPKKQVVNSTKKGGRSAFSTEHMTRPSVPDQIQTKLINVGMKVYLPTP